MSVQVTRLTVVAHGEQPYSLQTTYRVQERTIKGKPVPSDGWLLTVTVGALTIECQTAGAVRHNAQAWSEATKVVRFTFPEQAEDTVPAAEAPGSQVSALVRMTSDVEVKMTALTADVSPDSRPHVVVRSGTLMVRCYDPLAVASWARAWREAAAVAAKLWQVRDGFAEAEAIEAAWIAKRGQSALSDR